MKEVFFHMLYDNIPVTDAITERELRHEALSEQAGGEAVVLLKNNGTLPIKKGAVALYGPGARETITGGTGSGKVNGRRSINIEEGLKEGGFEILTSGWLDRYSDKRRQSFSEFKENAARQSERIGMPEHLVMMHNHFYEPAPVSIEPEDIFNDRTDTAIYVIYRNSGEGADRRVMKGDYLFYEEELENLRLLSDKYEKLILILNIGGVMDMKETDLIPGIGAILLMSQLGNTGGRVITRVLTGEVVPSGRLSDTWARNYEDYPSSDTFSDNDGDVNDEYYKEGIFTGYRYFDTFSVKPFYPFGYGLSYTEFSLAGVSASVKGSLFSVKVRVENTGKVFAGKEVVQVYVSQPEGRLKKPVQVLAGYKKTGELKPGEREDVDIEFDIRELASYDAERAEWILEKGDYIIRIGKNAADAAAFTVLTLNEEKVTSRLKNCFGGSTEFDELTPPKRPVNESPEGLLRLVADPDTIGTEAVEYTVRREALTPCSGTVSFEDVLKGIHTAEELVAQLSIEELAHYCVGAQAVRSEEGFSVVGDASRAVPGAAGDTSSKGFEKYGIPNIVMADGPAGLRLIPHFKTLRNGELVKGGQIVGEEPVPFDPSVPLEDTVDHYQYCTALPIGWALAQTWNEELIYEAGRIVGAEMELFDVDLWLAPALNIHRNPLCGRNFEYFSEDPLLSGRMAAAITRGVQSCPGKGVTIKHFAANSQEANRYFTNSHIGERALREIYLKGFEIAVKQAEPYSVMTSYNLLNGIHTANSFELNQNVLRDEWGFDGLVMTDWCTSIDDPDITGPNNSPYPISASTGCVWAGNDLQMPGRLINIEDLISAVSDDKEVDGFRPGREDLEHSALNVIKTVVRIFKSRQAAEADA